MLKMRMNVNHNGKAYAKGDECPAEHAEYFKAQGFTEAVAEAAKKSEPEHAHEHKHAHAHEAKAAAKKGK